LFIKQLHSFVRIYNLYCFFLLLLLKRFNNIYLAIYIVVFIFLISLLFIACSVCLTGKQSTRRVGRYEVVTYANTTVPDVIVHAAADKQISSRDHVTSDDATPTVQSLDSVDSRPPTGTGVWVLSYLLIYFNISGGVLVLRLCVALMRILHFLLLTLSYFLVWFVFMNVKPFFLDLEELAVCWT